jgi:hypothetical protein
MPPPPTQTDGGEPNRYFAQLPALRNSDRLGHHREPPPFTENRRRFNERPVDIKAQVLDAPAGASPQQTINIQNEVKPVGKASCRRPSSGQEIRSIIATEDQEEVLAPGYPGAH